MPYVAQYQTQEPTREEVDELSGPVLLEFGTNWCPICQAIQPQLKAILGEHPQIKHVKVEDGKGRPLGRSFGVKLWPNFVVMKDGQVLRQLARPQAAELQAALREL
jgi:thioredoxin 1